MNRTNYNETKLIPEKARLSEEKARRGEALPRLTEAEARTNMVGAYVTTPEDLTHCVEHISKREAD